MPDSTLRLLIAAGLSLSWCALTTHAWQRARKAHTSVVPPGKTPVIFASQTGSAEALALTAVQALGDSNAVAVPVSSLNTRMLEQTSRALFILSTSGEGDAPDMAYQFEIAMSQAKRPDLTHLSYGLLALGDRRYANFCCFGQRAHEWLQRCGARCLFEPVLANQQHADDLERWNTALADTLGANPRVVDRQDTPWKLVRRRHSNPGSLGRPCYELELEPLDTELPEWQAGDIASVLIEPHGVRRDYSIASLPQEGKLKLLIRRHISPTGTPGLGSDWLTNSLEPGALLSLQIRRNPEFQLSGEDAPALFIGNGTGIAGLRALLKQRFALGHRQNWLIYGERQQACDQHYGNELEQWQERSLLARLTLTFSRDQPAARYVHHALLEEADAVRAWLEHGAYVFVCGSRNGMADDVDRALQSIAGPALYQRLTDSGRYRRDVY